MAGAGAVGPEVQKISNKALGDNVFQIAAKQLQPAGVNNVRNALNAKFGLKTADVTSVGPTFGKTVANSAIVAIIASLLLISVYVALRFEWKFAVPVLIALMHDLLITAGVYSLTGREVTTATVAALLTILGYSMYDTIIVFDRVRENIPRMPRAAFSQIVNRSMSEVLTRSLATTSCTLMPILALLFFGGATLRDFAFALLIGVASGAYSSIFIASPVLTHWKEREPQYRARRHRIEDELGEVPAYAPTGADVEPARRGSRRGPAGSPSLQPDKVSAAEFEQMKRDSRGRAPGAVAPDLDDHKAPPAEARAQAGARPQTARRRQRRQRRRRRGDRQRRRCPARAGHRGERRRLADAESEAPGEVQATQQTSREAQVAMGALAWVMMGLALWHFTIWLPDRYWGGIVGAFLGALIGAVRVRVRDQRLQRPRTPRNRRRYRARGDPRRADRDGARLLRGRPPRARRRGRRASA